MGLLSNHPSADINLSSGNICYTFKAVLNRQKCLFEVTGQYVALVSSEMFILCEINVFGNLSSTNNYIKNLAEKKPTFFSCSNQADLLDNPPSRAVDGLYSTINFMYIQSNPSCPQTYWAVSLLQKYMVQSVVVIKDNISKY